MHDGVVPLQSRDAGNLLAEPRRQRSASDALPPLVYAPAGPPSAKGGTGGLAIYMFGTGKYAPKGTGIFVFSRQKDQEQVKPQVEVSSWLYSHDNPRYPADHKPLVRAWDLDTGEVVWERGFSHLGSGGDDAGLCVLGDTVYYSCFFGYAATRRGEPGPKGVTAALDPATGRVLWQTTDYSVTAGCTISGRDGRLYLGGYNAPDSKSGPRFVWCLDAEDGSLVWQSEPVVKAINVVTVGKRFVFGSAYGSDGFMIDKETGKVVSKFNEGYACTRFSLSEPYVLGANADLIDTSDGNRLVSTGPVVDVRECVGAIVSNGRIFYTAQASGLQMSKVSGLEPDVAAPPWE